MPDYEIKIDLDTGRGTIRELPDYSDIDLPIFDKVSNIIFYIAGLAAFVTMLITMLASKNPFWPIAAVIVMVYIAVPILMLLPVIFPYNRKLKQKNMFKIVLNMLLGAYLVLVCLEVYLAATVGANFSTISILVVCMYGIYFLPFLFWRQAKIARSLFTCIYAWVACIASVVLFLIFGEVKQVIGDMGPVLLPFFMSVFYMIHDVIKAFLRKKKKYGNFKHYEDVAPAIGYGILGLLVVGIIGVAIYGATLAL